MPHYRTEPQVISSTQQHNTHRINGLPHLPWEHTAGEQGHSCPAWAQPGDYPRQQQAQGRGWNPCPTSPRWTGNMRHAAWPEWSPWPHSAQGAGAECGGLPGSSKTRGRGNLPPLLCLLLLRTPWAFSCWEECPLLLACMGGGMGGHLDVFIVQEKLCYDWSVWICPKRCINSFECLWTHEELKQCKSLH